MQTEVLTGKSFPLGATVYPDGVNFSVFSKNNESLELLLFDAPDDASPSRIIRLDPHRNRTFYYWHVFVPGLRNGQLYGYRVNGPLIPEHGHRYDGSKLLLDPYTRAVTGNYVREAAISPGDNCAYAYKSVVVDNSAYDWQNDNPLRLPYSGTIIYELHVGGMTRHPNSGVAPEKRGTYAGLIEKIPYLRDLGITAVELLPVQQFDTQDAPVGGVNYWGYSPIGFFAPHNGYCSCHDPLGVVDEFRDMVKAFHRAGIEVILDVVFNHTAEGNENGPTLCFRGLENRAYYIPDSNPSCYANYSGCGNTLNTNHSIVRRMILDCLRYWVADMHVDGFRFDLASVMARDEWGIPLKSPPILWEIESDPVLAETKIIAEAWDAYGLYQVGTFIGHRWAEWNGQFRDNVRRFVKGDLGTVPTLAQSIAASPALYFRPERDANRSINFITCHDGFTLNDLVSYDDKHNEANGENNRDGSPNNLSWNCGIEGPTDNPAVEQLRLRQIKNLITILFMSQGTPMLMMGDEIRRTQHGNNNAYGQDSELSWFDWSGLETHAGLLRFVRELIRFTQSRSIFCEEHFWIASDDEDDSHITWHGVHLGEPDWGDDSHSLAFTLAHADSDEVLHIMLNAYWEPLEFELPPVDGGSGWWRVVDTALPSPDDFCDPQTTRPLKLATYQVEPRSSVILLARRGQFFS